MNQLLQKKVFLTEINTSDKKCKDVSGISLGNLYYWGQDGNPVNNHNLSFAGENLFEYSQFQFVKEYIISFYAESDDERFREAWADPLRSEILQRLAKDGYCWYIGYRSCWPMQIYDEYSKILLDMHVTRLPMWELSQVAFVDSGYRVGMGKGLVKKPIFEVKIEDLHSFVKEVWQSANPAFSIEGYCMPKGNLELLRQWNEMPRDEVLFQKVLDACHILFFTVSSEHKHFYFITNKTELDQLEVVLDLKKLQQLASQL